MSYLRLPLDTYASDTTACHRDLGSALSDGSLALVLGAGASVGMGLPAWWRLVKECLQGIGDAAAAGIDEHTATDELLRGVGRLERSFSGNRVAYRNAVRAVLYRNCKSDDALLDQKLLSVLGAMTMASRRGSVNEVVTFNFDDILERYLSLHGFVSQVVVTLPALRTDCDVTVYHPHGFLSSGAGSVSDSEEIILSKLSFDRRLGDRLNMWTELVRDLVLRKVILCVGLSCNSITFSSLLADLAETVRHYRGATGFWLVGPGDGADAEAELKERNIVPIRMADYDAYVPFLLSVCQQAARA